MVIFPIVIFLLVIEALIIFGHFAVYSALVSVFGLSGKLRLIGWWTFALLSVSFLVSSLITNLSYMPALRWVYAASSIWLGTLYWLFFASAIYFILYGGAFLLNMPAPKLIGGLLLTAAVIISGYGLYHANQTVVTHYTVSLKNLPENWNGKSIAMVADTHLGNVRGAAFAARIGKLINKQQPEAIIIAGDFYDGPPVDFLDIARQFKQQVSPPKGIYYANGNHEEFTDNNKYTSALAAAGVTILKNKLQTVDGIQIAGVDYNNTNTEQETKQTLAAIDLNPTMPSILIKHAPTGIHAVAQKGFDLQVSGHTHSGQVWPGPWLTRRIYGKFAAGMQNSGSLTVITTTGAGTWGPPQRVGTNSEVVIITLLQAK